MKTAIMVIEATRCTGHRRVVSPRYLRLGGAGEFVHIRPNSPRPFSEQYPVPLFTMDALAPPFRAGNVEFAYQLHYHLGFRTKRRVPVFRSSRRADGLRETLSQICQRSQYHVLESETDELWVRLLLSLRPDQSPAVVARTIKCNSSRLLFQSDPAIERQVGGRSLWCARIYVRSVGEVTSEVVQRYVARQRQHHEIDLRDSRQLALLVHPCPEQYFDLRSWSHCVAEYNCHLVWTPATSRPAIDASVAHGLLAYLSRIASAKRVDVLSLAILEDHVHLFATLRPAQSVQDLTLAVMNNSWYWLWRHNPGALKLWDAPEFWAHSAFVRTAGAATTNQVRARFAQLEHVERSR